MWDLFESLTSYQWQCKCASKSFVFPFLPPYDLYAQSSCVNLGIYADLEKTDLTQKLDPNPPENFGF